MQGVCPVSHPLGCAWERPPGNFVFYFANRTVRREGVLVTATTSMVSMRANMARRLAQKLGKHKYQMWFGQSATFSWSESEGRLDVTVVSTYAARWIRQHYGEIIRAAAAEELDRDVALNVIVQDAAAPSRNAKRNGQTERGHDDAAVRNAAPARSNGASRGAHAPARRDDPFDDGRAPQAFRHRLEDFVIGSSNQLAYAAAEQFVTQPHPREGGHTSMLFIHGGCGLGKTHLLQGICARMIDIDPAARVQYLTGEQFTNEFLTAIRTNGMDKFRKRIRNLDLFVVDDVHFIADKDKTQREFLHSLDAMEMGGARLVMASDCHPRQIRQFSEALVSRCVCGMVAQVHAPDADTRRKLISEIAKRRGMQLLDNALELLVRRCAGSVREIEGALTKLHALAILMKTHSPGGAAITGVQHGRNGNGASRYVVVGRALVEQLYADQRVMRANRPVRFGEIFDTVVRELHVDREAVLGRNRQRHVVMARAMIVHLARKMTSMSYPEIAHAMGRDNHSTVITAAKRVEDQLQVDEPDYIPPGTIEPVTVADLAARLREAVLRGE